MIHVVHHVYFFLILCSVPQIISICVRSYSNLCDYNGNDNTTETGESICDCQEVTFCFVIDLSQECNPITINLNTKANITLLSQLQCDVSSLEFQEKIPVFKLLNKTDNEITVNILTDSDFGRYKFVCDVLMIPDEFNTTSCKEWKILNVNPKEVLVHSELELHLTVVKQTDISQPSPWCFLHTPDSSVEIMATSWISDSKIYCSGFTPVVPGIFTVSLGSVMMPNIFDMGINIKVLSKHPVALKAEYSFDFVTIFIYFDENIELYSTCSSVFPKQYLKYFGMDFYCSIKGNIFVLKMGANFKIIDSLVINPDNKICQAGSQNTEFCLPALPLRLLISKPKVSGPNLSLYVDSACGVNSTQKYMSVKVLSSDRANPAVQNQTFQIKNSGKSQRKNLMIWRTMRQFQSRISPRVTLQMSATDVLPVLENLSLLDNILNIDTGNTISPTATVSVFVRSSPTTSFIVAEANVTFCEGSITLFRYKWYVNEQNIFENEKFIIVKDLAPGKYVVKCIIIAHNSSDILGEGWTTTEVLANNERVLIVPSEITVGTADDIFLRAVTWRGNSVSWTCKKDPDNLCFTTNQKLVSDIFDLNSPNISIPGGTLPVGNYIWTVKNARGLNQAKIYIKPENVTAINVEISSILVKPSQVVVLRGIVRKGERNCRAWWSSVRQKGFNYFNFQMIERPEGNSFTEQYSTEEVLVEIPSSENQKKFESDAFYMFKFQVFCPFSSKKPKGSLDYVKIPIGVRNPPRISPLIVEPLEGKAMITNFMISGADVNTSDEDNPLLFEWSYVDPCDVVIPIKRGASSKNFTTYLPPGGLKLIVKVCSGEEICNTVSSPTINVLQAFEFRAENFYQARHRIQYLMTSGDILEAFGLAITVFKSLLSIVQPKVREEVFLTVEETIKVRIDDLIKRMRFDPKAIKLSLDFLEQALKVAKYFRKDSDIMNILMEFKNSISQSVSSQDRVGVDEN